MGEINVLWNNLTPYNRVVSFSWFREKNPFQWFCNLAWKHISKSSLFFSFPGYTSAGTPYKVPPTQSNGAPPPYTPTPTPYPTAMYPIRSAYPQQNIYAQVAAALAWGHSLFSAVVGVCCAAPVQLALPFNFVAPVNMFACLVGWVHTWVNERNELEQFVFRTPHCATSILIFYIFYWVRVCRIFCLLGLNAFIFLSLDESAIKEYLLNWFLSSLM